MSYFNKKNIMLCVVSLFLAFNASAQDYKVGVFGDPYPYQQDEEGQNLPSDFLKLAKIGLCSRTNGISTMIVEYWSSSTQEMETLGTWGEQHWPYGQNFWDAKGCTGHNATVEAQYTINASISDNNALTSVWGTYGDNIRTLNIRVTDCDDGSFYNGYFGHYLSSTHNEFSFVGDCSLHIKSFYGFHTGAAANSTIRYLKSLGLHLRAE